MPLSFLDDRTYEDDYPRLYKASSIIVFIIITTITLTLFYFDVNLLI